LAWGGAPEDLAGDSPRKTLDNANGELIFTGPTKPLAVRSALLESSAMLFTLDYWKAKIVDHSVEDRKITTPGQSKYRDIVKRHHHRIPRAC
jgi:hypothetical protein